jgi:hypothetical protein
MGFGISGVESSGFMIRVLVSQRVMPQIRKTITTGTKWQQFEYSTVT